MIIKAFFVMIFVAIFSHPLYALNLVKQTQWGILEQDSFPDDWRNINAPALQKVKGDIALGFKDHILVAKITLRAQPTSEPFVVPFT